MPEQSGTDQYLWLEDVSGETTDRILGEAAALQAWLGPTRVSASFPTPLELELRA